MKDGETIAADLVVLATGYKRQEELVRLLFGDAVMSRVGIIWGFDVQPETLVGTGVEMGLERGGGDVLDPSRDGGEGAHRSKVYP